MSAKSKRLDVVAKYHGNWDWTQSNIYGWEAYYFYKATNDFDEPCIRVEVFHFDEEVDYLEFLPDESNLPPFKELIKQAYESEQFDESVAAEFVLA